MSVSYITCALSNNLLQRRTCIFRSMYNYMCSATPPPPGIDPINMIIEQVELLLYEAITQVQADKSIACEKSVKNICQTQNVHVFS